MNINKQTTKGNKMKKIAMIIGLLTVLATSANAFEIISIYNNGFGSSSIYSSSSGLVGTTYTNGFGTTTLTLW